MRWVVLLVLLSTIGLGAEEYRPEFSTAGFFQSDTSVRAAGKAAEA